MDFDRLFDDITTSVRIDFAQSTPSPDGDELSPCRDAVVGLSFSERGFGFGQICLFQSPEGAFIDTECMGREKVLQYLTVFLNSAILDTDQDPERHAAYNRARRRTCYDACPACVAYKAMKGGEETTP